MTVCTQPPPNSFHEAGGAPGTGGVPTRFTPSPIGEASAALFDLIWKMALGAIFFLHQLLKEVLVQAQLGVALKKVYESIGNKMRAESIVVGTMAIFSGAITLMAGFVAWKMGMNEVKQSQEELNGMKNYQKALKETPPADVVLHEGPSAEEGQVDVEQRMSEEDMQKAIDAMKKRNTFVDENGKSLNVSKEERDCIRLMKRDHNGEFRQVEDSYDEKIKAQEEKCSRAQGSFGNKLNSMVTITGAFGNAATGAGQAGVADIKKQQSDLQGQETTGRTAMELNQAVMGQMNNEDGKFMNIIDQIAQEFANISSGNHLGG